MNSLRRHLSYANVVATLALLFAMSGGALAAKHYLINSTRQVNPKVLKKLKGKPGKTGAVGPQGASGPRGPAGLNGKDGTNGTNGANGNNGATKVTVRTATGPEVKEKELSTAAVECQPGEHMTGGGVDVTNTGFVVVLENYPNGGNQWVATVKNTATGAPTLLVAAKAYALCASP
jgi:hypothetical protein